MQKHTVAIIGLGRMGSTIDDEGHARRRALFGGGFD